MYLSAAGNAFSQAALLHLQMQSKHDAATNFIDAGNAFKKSDPQGILSRFHINCFTLLNIQLLAKSKYWVSVSKHPCTVMCVFDLHTNVVTKK